MTATGQQDVFAFENLIDVFDWTSEQTFSDDCHLTPEGNRIIAERLFQLLSRSCTGRVVLGKNLARGLRRAILRPGTVARLAEQWSR